MIGMGMGILASALIGGGTAVYGNKKASAANKRADAVAQSTNDAAMAWERELETRRQDEFDRLEAERRTQWDADQKRLDEETAYSRSMDARQLALKEADIAEEKRRYEATETRRAPWRAAGAGSLKQIGDLAGVRINPSALPEGVTVEDAAPAPVANTRALGWLAKKGQVA